MCVCVFCCIFFFVFLVFCLYIFFFLVGCFFLLQRIYDCNSTLFVVNLLGKNMLKMDLWGIFKGFGWVWWLENKFSYIVIEWWRIPWHRIRLKNVTQKIKIMENDGPCKRLRKRHDSSPGARNLQNKREDAMAKVLCVMCRWFVEGWRYLIGKRWHFFKGYLYT